jgi:hypothetical protein
VTTRDTAPDLPTNATNATPTLDELAQRVKGVFNELADFEARRIAQRVRQNSRVAGGIYTAWRGIESRVLRLKLAQRRAEAAQRCRQVAHQLRLQW